jgi:hypothetical protein
MTGPSITTRLFLGFIAGAISHVVFQGALGVLYYAGGIIPSLPWSLAPLPPFGVPTTLNFAFWAGLWGLPYALLEPRSAKRIGTVSTGLLFGIAAQSVLWFVVQPLKGLGVGAGFPPETVLIYVGYHLVFGLGLAFTFAALRAVSRNGAEVNHALSA